MAFEYKLSFAAKDIDERLRKAGKAILTTPQELTEAKKAQARENFGASVYYNTKREELDVNHEDINADYIWGLYDELMSEHPENVKKNEVHNDDGTFTNYEYVISTGEYRTDGKFTDSEYYKPDNHIKKPKYIVLSGIHGDERAAALSAYRFFRDVLNGHNVPLSFKEGVIIHVMPVGTPSAINLFTRENEDGVDINRNFGFATPAKETQAITNWLNANTDADLFIDCHNSGALNEVVVILGDSNNDAVDMVKRIALQGVDRIIPFWRDVIGYHPVEVEYLDENNEPQVGVRDVIFSCSVSGEIERTATYYALNALGTPSVTIETSVYYGNYSDWVVDKKVCPPETIAAGAEAIGNILIELYEQSFFGEVVDDMKVIDSKLNILLEFVNSCFRMESGSLVVESDDTGATVKIPCSNGAKMLVFQADDATYTKIIEETSATDGYSWTIGVLGNCIAKVGSKDNRGYASRMTAISAGNSTYWMPSDFGTTCDNTDGFAFGTNGIKAGTYNWTAYYWND